MATRSDLEAVRGRAVRCADGEHLGQVSECREHGFLCDRGGFFPTTWVITYADVASIDATAVVLTRPLSAYRGPSLRSGAVVKRPTPPEKG